MPDRPISLNAALEVLRYCDDADIVNDIRALPSPEPSAVLVLKAERDELLAEVEALRAVRDAAVATGGDFSHLCDHPNWPVAESECPCGWCGMDRALSRAKEADDA